MQQQDLRPLQQQPSPRNSRRAKVVVRTPRLRCSCADRTAGLACEQRCGLTATEVPFLFSAHARVGSLELVREEELAFLSLVATCVGGSMGRWSSFDGLIFGRWTSFVGCRTVLLLAGRVIVGFGSFDWWSMGRISDELPLVFWACGLDFVRACGTPRNGFRTRRGDRTRWSNHHDVRSPFNSRDMRNPQSKSTEQTTAADVPPGVHTTLSEWRSLNRPMVIAHMMLQARWRGQMLPTMLTIYTQVVQGSPLERMILEQPDDNRTSSFLYNEASLPAPSNLTQDYGTDVAQSANVAVHAHGRDALEVLPLSDATSEHITTGSVMKKT
ncbi:uncharacterized protein LOC119278332 [Triticum dicoccoides]|uniref:uncharacterized protein LOC119278332 n=1 Tax=Triticum dicoccoides TaxID=85692 RepID=UPI00188E3CFF|nr:uncharacterized protein LOC119278332 [Triticum dicoccoides]XP_044351684.1 uncharacterized protein LOC123072182 isoform X2 [Triticum aestivum]